MTFDEILSQVVELLQREGRISYPALKLRLSLEDPYLDSLKAELIDAKPTLSQPHFIISNQTRSCQ